MLLQILPDGTRKNMLVAKFNEMVLFSQELRRSCKKDDSQGNGLKTKTEEQTSKEGSSVCDEDYDEILVTYRPPTSFPADFPGERETSSLSVPLRPDAAALRLTEVPISLHNSETVGYDMGSTYNGWFSRCFGFKVMLVYLGTGGRERRVLGNLSPNSSHVPKSKGEPRGAGDGDSTTARGSWLGGLVGSMVPGLGSWMGKGGIAGIESGEEDGDEGPAKITFADCAPYLIVTRESLADVSLRLPEGEEMDITKFRPNIVLSGADFAWEEDFWGALEVLPTEKGSATAVAAAAAKDDENPSSKAKARQTRLILTANCARCVSINIDYKTGRQGKGESGGTLKKLMKDRRVDMGNKWSPVFGRYGFLEGSTTIGKGKNQVVVTIGDEVKVAKRVSDRTTWGEFDFFYPL